MSAPLVNRESYQPSEPSGSRHAPTKNIQSLASLVTHLSQRSTDLPGIGVFYGPSGYGKSHAAGRAHVKFNCIYIQLASFWTPKMMLEEALISENINPPSKTRACFNALCELLDQEQMILIIDEFDYATKGRSDAMVEMVRDIYEQTQQPVIVIGEEQLPQKLRKYDRFHNRVLEWRAAEPCDLEDARILAEIYSKEMTLSDDLLERMIEATHGNTRRICTSIEMIRTTGVRQGIQHMTAATWGDRGFFTSTPPAARRVHV